jgi:hypothetical protein
MASSVYAKALINLMKANINLETADIRCMIVDTADYTYSEAHEFVSDVAAAGIVARSSALVSKTLGVVGKGVFDAADKVLSAVTGDGTEAVIVYVYNAADASAMLLSYNEGTVVPNGNDITVQWAAGGIAVF